MSRWILFALIGMAFGVVMAAENCFSDFDPNITPDPQNRFRGFLTREGKEAGYILVLSRDLSYSTVKIKFEKEYLEVDTRDFFRQPEARQVTVGMVVKEDLQRLKATKIICSGTLSADNAAGSEVSLYFAGYKSGKHFWRRKVFPIPEKKETFLLQTECPEKLWNPTLYFEFKSAGIYRIYDFSLHQSEPKDSVPSATNVDIRKNYLQNGGAERFWYGISAENYEDFIDPELGMVLHVPGQIFDHTLKMALDSKVFRSGKRSFRLTRKGRFTLGRFTLGLVPFRPGKPARFTAWIKGEKNTRATLEFFLGSGIAFNKTFPVSTEWTKCDYYIPAWGQERGAGDAVNGYAAVHRLASVNIKPAPGTTIWIDDAVYTLGGIPDGKSPQNVTASARFDNPKQYFFTGEKLSGKIQLSHLGRETEEVRISWKIVDFFGETIARSSEPQTVQLNGGEDREVNFEIMPPEHLRGAANLFFDVNGECTGLYFGVMDPPGALLPRLGVQTGWENAHVNVAMLKDFRIGSIRLWQTPRRLPFYGFREATGYHRAGFYVMLCVDGMSGVMPLDYSKFSVLKNRHHWLAQMEERIRKHRGEIDVYEIFNEPEFRGEGINRNPDPDQYELFSLDTCSSVIRDLAKVIRKNDPEALIAGCGTHNPGWSASVLEKATLKNMDFITAHAYRSIPELPDYFAEIQGMKRDLARKFGRDIRIDQSEAGACSTSVFPEDNRIPDYERNRVALNIRMMLSGFAGGISRYYHFAASVSSGTSWGMKMMGNPDNQFRSLPAPVMFACRTAADMLENGRFSERVKLGSRYKCYIFERGDCRVATLWKINPDPAKRLKTDMWNSYVCIWDGRNEKMQLSESLRKNARIYDVMGTLQKKKALEISPYPYYIVSALSVGDLRNAIKSSRLLQSSDCVESSILVQGRRNFAIRLTNGGTSALDGTLSCAGREYRFSGLTAEETRVFEFETEKEINEKKQRLNAVLEIPTTGVKKSITVDLQNIAVPYVERIFDDDSLDDWPENSVEVPLKVCGKCPAWNSQTDDVQAKMRLAWNQESLYLSVTVWKNNLQSALGISRLYEGDGLQIAFDTLSNAPTDLKQYQDDDFEYAVGFIDGNLRVFRHAVSSAAYDSFSKSIGPDEEMQRAVKVLPDRVVYELAFPILGVSPFKLIPGASMRMNVLVNIANENGRAGYLQLTPGIGEAKQPGQFMNITLLPKGR